MTTTLWGCLGNMKSRTLKIRNSRIIKKKKLNTNTAQNPQSLLREKLIKCIKY